MKTLHKIKRGEEAIIREIKQDSNLANSLLEQGFVPGTKVSLLIHGFLGGPSAYLMRGSKIALRKEEAEAIFI